MTVLVLITGRFFDTSTCHECSDDVIGATSGIGYATAKHLTSMLDHHVIQACRYHLKGKAAVRSIQNTSTSPVSISALELDVDNASSIVTAAQTVANEFGKLDVLINNAGVYNAHQYLESQLTSCFRTNVIGPALVTDAFRPLLLQSPNPYLLHIGSALGSLTLTADSDKLDSSLNCPGYKISKAALSMLSIEHAKALGPQGVKVFLIHPGLIESELRGSDESARTAGGRALKPEVAAESIWDVMQGKRDGDVGKHVHRDGVWPW